MSWSLERSLSHVSISMTFMKSDESSAKGLMLKEILLVKSLMCIKNKRGPSTEPCGASDKMGSHPASIPFSAVPCLLFEEKMY